LDRLVGDWVHLYQVAKNVFLLLFLLLLLLLVLLVGVVLDALASNGVALLL
jgi:hypothetical protein